MEAGDDRAACCVLLVAHVLVLGHASSHPHVHLATAAQKHVVAADRVCCMAVNVISVGASIESSLLPAAHSSLPPPPCRVEAREQLRRQVGTLRLDLNTLASAKAGKEDKKKALALRQDFLTKVRGWCRPGLACAAQGYWCWCCVGGTHACAVLSGAGQHCAAALQALDAAMHIQAVVARHCVEAVISPW